VQFQFFCTIHLNDNIAKKKKKKRKKWWYFGDNWYWAVRPPQKKWFWGDQIIYKSIKVGNDHSQSHWSDHATLEILFE
jgi:hypothetical protein